MRAVNLLPQDERRKGLEAGARTPLLVAAGGIALVTIAATFLASMSSVSASDARSERDSVQAQISALPPLADHAVSHGTLVKERSDRVAALAAALQGRVSFDSLLRQISYVMPEDAWLTQLDASSPVDATTTDPATPPAAESTATPDVTIQGGTWTHENIAVVLTRLAAVPSFESIQLTGSTLVEPSADSEEGQPDSSSATTKRHVTFVVSATLKSEVKS